MKYNVDYFINFFKSKPNDTWTIHRLTDDHGRFCAMGHLGAKRSWYGGSKKGSKPYVLGEMVADVLHLDITDINDGAEKKFKQKTPKGRVLAALNEIKKKQKL